MVTIQMVVITEVIINMMTKGVGGLRNPPTSRKDQLATMRAYRNEKKRRYIPFMGCCRVAAGAG